MLQTLEHESTVVPYFALRLIVIYAEFQLRKLANRQHPRNIITKTGQGKCPKDLVCENECVKSDNSKISSHPPQLKSRGHFPWMCYSPVTSNRVACCQRHPTGSDNEKITLSITTLTKGFSSWILLLVHYLQTNVSWYIYWDLISCHNLFGSSLLVIWSIKTISHQCLIIRVIIQYRLWSGCLYMRH